MSIGIWQIAIVVILVVLIFRMKRASLCEAWVTGPVLATVTGAVASAVAGVVIASAEGSSPRGCGRVLLGGVGVIEPSPGALTGVGRF